MISTVVSRYRFRTRLTSAYVDLLRNESSPLLQTRTESLCDVKGRNENQQESRRQRQFGEEAAYAPGIRDLEERHGLDGRRKCRRREWIQVIENKQITRATGRTGFSQESRAWTLSGDYVKTGRMYNVEDSGPWAWIGAARRWFRRGDTSRADRRSCAITCIIVDD
jgi:hypothetical protein